MNIEISDQDLGKRIDSFLSKYFHGTPASAIQRLLRKKLIKVNNKKAESNYKLQDGDEINIVDFIYKNLEEKTLEVKPKKIQTLTKAQLKNFTNTIVYEDDDLMAINKPFGLAVQGGSNVKTSVNDYVDFINANQNKTLKLVHRLDRDTTGILLIAKTPKSSEKLTTMFKKKDALEKTYIALVIGIPTKKTGTIKIPLLKKFQGGVEKVYCDNIKGKDAITKYKILGSSNKYNISLAEIQILTGRTHQIRVHMKELGYPVLGDVKYGGKKSLVEGFDDKLHLHALKIKLKDLIIKAPLPKHIQNSIEKLNLNNILNYSSK
jgi:23S rRNA pseudouridine955/2504/2580 synthase